ncbi:conserved hypothetical protein [Paraburkholderia ribeironis]|uniref:Uncharacterized protein n=1 Tax=Paraburkholderia ribeironis TaxID=1247936 RepID=A0A1N7SMA3_9BURK|nr:hypothetical protein [Paraburkholderia ribeironis]SIT48109.1 conserved hypothetical protein [Paraburkholderia ribeironis]
MLLQTETDEHLLAQAETPESTELDQMRCANYWKLLQKPTASLMRCTDDNPQSTSAAVPGYNQERAGADIRQE